MYIDAIRSSTKCECKIYERFALFLIGETAHSKRIQNEAELRYVLGDPIMEMMCESGELKACIDADFLYVGLRVYHLKAKLDTAPSRFSFGSFTRTVSSSLEMQNTIKRDMMELADAEVGRRTGYKADGSFLKVGGVETCVYIYEHKTQHAQCSQTHFSQIGGGIIINVTRG
ncbi:hypothetical protein GBAR_LOCUS31261, partial [Geodia barretti]